MMMISGMAASLVSKPTMISAPQMISTIPTNAARLGETQPETDDRSREISAFFFPELRPSKSV
jgi:hypothetical protein